MTRTHVWTVGLAGLVLVALTSCGQEQQPGSGSADRAVAASAQAEISGKSGFVQLPHGRVDFQVSEAATVDRAWMESDKVKDLPDDQQFVGVDWTFSPGEGVPADASGFAIADDVPAQMQLRIGDKDVLLGDAYSVPGGDSTVSGAFVPVDAGTTLDDAWVEVVFDGLTQGISVVDGRRANQEAAALYEPMTTPEKLNCAPRIEPTELKGELKCIVAARSLPWVTDLGWADEGSTWWVVDAATSARDLRDERGGRYDVTGMRDATTVDGAAAAATFLEEYSDSADELRTQQVFLAPTGAAPKVTVERELTWSVQDEGALREGETMRLLASAG